MKRGVFQDMLHTVQKVETPVKSAALSAKGAALAYLQETRDQRNPESQALFRQHALCFAEWCEESQIGIDQVNGRVVNDFIEHLTRTHPPRKPGASTLAPTTTRGYRVVIKALLAWACDDEFLYKEFMQRSVVAKIKQPALPKIIIDTYSDHDIRSLLKACLDEQTERMRARARMIVLFLIGTGLRVSEAAALTLGDLHLEAGSAHLKVVAGKGDKTRLVILGEGTRRKLEAYCFTWRHGLTAQAPVFPARDEKAPYTALSSAGFQQLWRRLGSRAGIQNVRNSPHTARHTMAVRFMRAGGSLITLQRLLGHQDIKVTAAYLTSLGVDMQDLHDLAAPFLP